MKLIVVDLDKLEKLFLEAVDPNVVVIRPYVALKLIKELGVPLPEKRVTDAEASDDFITDSNTGFNECIDFLVAESEKK